MGRNLPAADGHRLERGHIFHRPGNLIDAVNCLLDQAVTTKPDKVIPVAQLPFEIGHARLALAGGRHRLDRRCVISAVNGADVADVTVVNMFEDFAAGIIVAPAKTGHQSQLLLPGFLDRGQRRANPGRVSGDGFLAENVFAGGHGGPQMLRTEAGRCGQKHHIHAAVDHLLISVESDEAVVGINLDLVANFAVEGPQAVFQLVLEDVRHRRQDNVVVRG